MKRPWHGVIPEHEEQLYKSVGLGKSTGIGARPALLIIDVQFRTTGTSPKPISEAVKEFPTACGEPAWLAVAQIARLLEVFRKQKLPVIYPCVAVKTEHDRGPVASKFPGLMSIPLGGYDFPREIAPADGDLKLPKAHASAFFGTDLASHLVRLGVDSLVVTGCSTSGCVRASTVDACSLNYRVTVVEDGVYDRSSVSHAVNLFDMAHKYADVSSADEVIRQLESGRK